MQQVAFTMRVKDGQQGEYIRRHREVWPEVLAELRQAGVHRMSIFLKDVELFVYMEVEDYVRAIRILSESPHSVRWEKYMSQIMEGEAGDEHDLSDAYPDSLPEVFFWQQPEQRMRSVISDGAGPSAPHFPQLSQPPLNRKVAGQ